MTEWRDETHDLLDDLIAGLEELWRTGNEPDLSPLLPPPDHPLRRSALVALIQTDQELRQQHGRPKTVEEYLAEWPELRDDPECVKELSASDEQMQADFPPAAPAWAGDSRADADFGPLLEPRAIPILCPHCRCRVEIVGRIEAGQVKCPSCASGIRLAAEASGSAQAGAPTLAQGGPPKIAHFELLELLGEGAFGSVWRARDTKRDRAVAIKIPRPGRVLPADADRFLRDARAPAGFQHGNIVTVLEVGQEGDLLYTVSELIEGQPLDRWLKAQGGRLADREAARLCATLAEALHAAHQRGMIHGNVKPGNIMIDAAGRPHLTDFGLSKPGAGEIATNVAGQIRGTPAYLSPEQARGDGHRADARSDVYCLGAILFELVTGQRPFRGDLATLLRQVVEEQAPLVRTLNRQVSRDLETVCAKCLEKSPARRYNTAGDLADDLGRFLSGEPIRARPVNRWQRFWRWFER